ncbi:MAG: AlwI family type II restriction endonuclease [Prevotella sp.]|nr:AlwI family type II restriction endonuclease [Bacteroidales bacterium]MDY4230012.1 AlwI family type II restriction endonuclease [Prevotella sp.]
MVPEIDLLIKNFQGKRWNKESQIHFMKILSEEQFFNGKGKNNPAFSARDRINRAPQSLGFLVLRPTVELTPAGRSLIKSKRKDEVILRQLMKFQVPSPYHKPSEKAADFWVKPYLELLRLVRHFGTLKFDELQIFGMQLTNWHKFDSIVLKIDNFRKEKLDNKGNYKAFKRAVLKRELKEIFAQRIAEGKTKTRESLDDSLENFLRTQLNNMRDYADACFRYLRATGLINVSQLGKSLSIVPERIDDVDYILANVGRDPVYVDEKQKYIVYLGDNTLPQLLTDNKAVLINRINHDFPKIHIATSWDISKLKDVLANLSEERKQQTLSKQVADIKDYKLYDDIQQTFEEIRSKQVYDAPLMLEWNTWRAMTMLDGGDIKANLNFDDFGKPLSTAAANLSDIVCDYGDFYVCVEVTMSSGQRQYEMEGEPVSRHLGKLKASTGKPCYCLFIAPTINDACIAHFFGLSQMNISYYGGKSVIVPLSLDVFRKMMEDSYKANNKPNPSNVRSFFEYSRLLSTSGCSEHQWFENMEQKAASWLSV